MNGLRATLFAATILVAAASDAPTAHAWECLSGSCPVWCETVPYGIGIVSDDLGEGTTVTETRRGMDDWTTRTCTDLTNNYTGRTSARAGAGDGQSVIGWVESGWRHGGSAIGVTGPRWNGRNCIIEADMEMNGVNFTWVTSAGRGSNVNTYSIALHEGGHYYGLGHSSDASATMYFAYTGGIDAIGGDDQNGICTLYPGEGGGSVDCTTAGCPSGQMCVDAECVEVMGDGSMCSPCTNSGQCGGSGDFCLGYPPTGTGFCGRSCSSSADCPDPSTDMCVGTSAGSQCIRVVGGSPDCSGGPSTSGCRNDSECSGDQICNTSTGTCEARPTGGLDLGAPCESNEACNSGLCATTPAGSVCSQSCNGFDTSSCPAGFYCDGEATGTCGTGLCLAGGAGTSPLGGSCTQDTDCATLMCDGGVCATPCQPGGATACPMGTTCQPGATPGCGSCKSEGSLGAPGDMCDTNEECASGLCAVRGEDDQFCTEVCTEVSDCPSGFDCVALGGISICVPPAVEPRDGGGGCGCRVPAGRASKLPWVLLVIIPALVWWRRRR